MSFSISSIMASILYGIAGLYIFRAGKKNGNIWLILTGLALMVYPYFVSNDILMWVVGAGLLGLSYQMRHA